MKLDFEMGQDYKRFCVLFYHHVLRNIKFAFLDFFLDFFLNLTFFDVDSSEG